ncbi:MAG TPA: DUF3293 domain-containing protein [Solimonas sp.]|nr:DUF3293 domain-containing protein [Solimonas sp.]
MSAATDRRALEAAYRRTRYVVLLPRFELVLSIDVHDPAADRRLALEAGCRAAWAMITPCNPFSVVASEEANRRALDEMRVELDACPARWLASVSRDPLGEWPDEPGYFLVDPDLAWVVELGRRYRQNAVVTGRLGGAPRLIFCHSERSEESRKEAVRGHSRSPSLRSG